MFNYKKVKKQSDNPFLNLYKLDAVDREGKVFDYYFVSRRDEEGIKLKTKDNNPEGIVVYAITDEESPRLLVIKEYRYPLDDYIYELPAGIIDSGEVAEQAAVREIKEEQDLTLRFTMEEIRLSEDLFIWDRVLLMNLMELFLELFMWRMLSNNLKVQSAYR